MKMPAHQLAGVGKRNLAERSSIHLLPTFFIKRFRLLIVRKEEPSWLYQ
jgi:hypothetical protein